MALATRQAVRRRQPSRGARADRAPHRERRLSLSRPARLGRPYADPRGQGRRRLRPARRDHGRRHRRGVRQDREAAGPALSRRTGGRGGGARPAIRERFALPRPMLGPAERGFFAVRPEDRGAPRRGAGRAAARRATSPTSAPRFRRRSSTWSRTACGSGSSCSASGSASRPRAVVVAGGVAANLGAPRARSTRFCARGRPAAGRAAAEAVHRQRRDDRLGGRRAAAARR